MATELPSTMNAWRFKWGETMPMRASVPVPQPKDNEVLVKVLAGGICHSDVGLFDLDSFINKAMQPIAANPFTCGHEGAGVIVAVGSSVSSTHPQLSVGRYIAVYAPNSCNLPSCLPCSTGNSNVCRTYRSYGLGLDGSWADYMAVRADSVVPIPADIRTIPPAVAAVATDAVSSPYHNLTTGCHLKAGETVLIYGVGGLGLNAVEIAKNLLGTTVIACDTRQTSLDQAKDIGADHVVKPDELLAYVQEHTLVIDAAVDFVGIQPTFDACFSVIRPGGVIHITGLMANSLNISPVRTMIKNLTVKTSYFATKSDLEIVLQAIADGKLRPRVEERPFSECAHVLHDMHEGKLKNRVAIVPDTVRANPKI